MTTYRITALAVKNFKRIHEIVIRPEADRALILIGGKNANGKSSILDALTTAFGGKKQAPADPVRHGAEEAELVVTLESSEGVLEVRRTIDPDGESVLEVRDRNGALRAQQSMLDRLVGGRFLDPLAFLNLPSKEQRARLMALIPGAERIAGLNAKRQGAFDRRTEVGRDLVKAEGELARTPEPEVGAPIDVAAITAEIDVLAAQQREGDALGRVLADREREVRDANYQHGQLNDREAAIEAEIDRLTREAENIRSQRETARARETAASEARAAAASKLEAAGQAWIAAGQPRRAVLDAQLARADAHNRAVFAAEAQRDRRAQVVAEVEKLTAERASLTAALDTIDSRKAQILAAAALPVEGLTIEDGGINLNGVPLDQASDAERWRVALALAIAASPGLSDIWVRDGALLDEESLAMVAEQAAAAGRRLWVEVVSISEPNTIVIRDGRVAGKTAPRAKTPAAPAPEDLP